MWALFWNFLFDCLLKLHQIELYLILHLQTRQLAETMWPGAELLAHAKRPLIIAQRGVGSAEAVCSPRGFCRGVGAVRNSVMSSLLRAGF